MGDHLIKPKPGRNNWQVRLDIPVKVRHAFINDKGKIEGKGDKRQQGLLLPIEATRRVRRKRRLGLNDGGLSIPTAA
jgi:hypothetical protein